MQKILNILKCNPKSYPSDRSIYNDSQSINFWHNLAKQYMPVKHNIMNEVKKNMKRLFGNSKNILGVKIRGTDYIKGQPKNHPVQPPVDMMISVVKIFDEKYKFDFIFFAAEDEEIRNKFLSSFDKRVKTLSLKNVKLIKKYNDEVNEVLNNMKNYLMNIIILSKCLDIITSRTSGAAGIFILTEGFRHYKTYYLVYY